MEASFDKAFQDIKELEQKFKEMFDRILALAADTVTKLSAEFAKLGTAVNPAVTPALTTAAGQFTSFREKAAAALAETRKGLNENWNATAIGKTLTDQLNPFTILQGKAFGLAAALQALGAVANTVSSFLNASVASAIKAEAAQLGVNGAWEKAPTNTFTYAIGQLKSTWDTLLTTVGNAIVKNHTVVEGIKLVSQFVGFLTEKLGKQHIGFNIVTGAIVSVVKVLSWLLDGINFVLQAMYLWDGMTYRVALAFAKMAQTVISKLADMVGTIAQSQFMRDLIPGLAENADLLKDAAELAAIGVGHLEEKIKTNDQKAKDWDKTLGGTAKKLRQYADESWNSRNKQVEIAEAVKKTNEQTKEATTTINNLVISQNNLTIASNTLVEAQNKLASAPIPTKLGEFYQGLSKDIWDAIPKKGLPAPPPPPPPIQGRDHGITSLVAPLVESKNVTQQITEHLEKGKRATEAWGKALENVAGIFTGLGSVVGGDVGKKLGEIGGIWKSGSEAGNKLATAFNIKDGKFDFSNFTGEKGVGATVGAYAGAATAAIGAVGQIKDATNVKGRGNRALRGAAAGAAIGANPALAASTMGISVAAGAVIGALVGAFRNPAFEDVYNRVAKNFGVKLSDETAKAIASLAKKDFKGDRQAAEIFSLDKIISEGGGVTDKNAKLLTDRLRDAFSMKETGKFTGEQLTETLNKNFGAFAEHVKKSKDLASKSFQEIIALNERFGSESVAIQEFVKGQTATLGSSIGALAGPLVEQYGGLAEKIAGAQAAVTQLSSQGKTGTDEYAAAVAALTGLQEQQRAGAAGASEEFERLGLIALAAFNASIQSGTDYVTAVQAMQPALGQLIQLQTDLGITTQNAALAELTSFSARVEANQGLVNATAALGETMRALASIGGLNTETLAAMEAQGMQTFERLTGAGFTEGQALQQMKDYLLNVVQAHEQLGTPIDENTGKLIEMARQQGILKADGTSMTDILKGGFEKLTDAVNAVARVLGADVPAAASLARQAIDDIPNRVEVEVDYRTRGYPDGDPANASATTEGFAKGTGGFRNFGSGTLAMLHGWEAVIPMNQLRGAGGGQGVEVNVWLNDQIIGRAAARGLPAMLDVYGATR